MTGIREAVIGAFLALFGILAGHTLLETARDALFLARLPPSQLPWVYLAIAGLAFGMGLGSWKRPRLLSGRYDLSVLLVACALVTFAFWRFSSLSRSAWTLYALYVWSGLVGTLTGMQFWLVLGELYTVTQAKRIYSVVGLGSVLGAIAGAAIALEQGVFGGIIVLFLIFEPDGLAHRWKMIKAYWKLYPFSY